jgi:hypothetical protein
MKNMKKFMVIAVLLITAAALGLYIKNSIEKKQEQEIAEYYTTQNDAFFISDTYSYGVNRIDCTVYRTLEDSNYDSLLYAWLLIYEQETGNVLTIGEIEEYLSQEFEEDGTRRLYINYENENIQNYIEFVRQMWQKTREQVANIPRDELQNIPWEERSYRDFDNRLSSAYYALPEEIREQYHWRTNMPFELVEEIVEKVYNPEYEMQLDEFLLQEVGIDT